MASLREIIIYQHFKALASKDEEVDRVFRMLLMGYFHPTINNLMKIFNQGQEIPNINLRQLSQQIDESIGSEVAEYYKYLTGKRNNPTCDELMVEVEKFKLDCQNLASIDREIANVSENILKEANKFYEYVEKHTKEFKLGFKLNYDHATGNLLCAKAQATCLKKRLEETEEAVHKYGKKEIVERLKGKRNDLETENQSLTSELEEKKKKLEKYEKLDPKLIEEYTKLKDELSCRLWAYRMVDRSSNCSQGSIGDLSC
ncbi:uncharacterized protein LOC128388684 [Panonychus citri]|uniref:uncharacterized protein LOC128388684 n=1 Tax=Panonychus citri TaxID=50023 RepID=UPI0023083346|nr:uncharacterized protein LOC128388684 [Panonychus citri]